MREDYKIKRMKALQNPPTSLSQPHKQLGTFRNSFERDVICNNNNNSNNNINVSVCNYGVITTLKEK